MPTTNVRRAAVLGKPVEHSLSPALHTAAYQVLGLDWEFSKFEVDVDSLTEFLQSTGDDVVGYALTMPLKDVAFENASTLDDFAQRTRAVNTLLRVDGQWQGFNTDVQGFINSLRQVGVTHAASPVVIGAGATARSAVAALAHLGAENVTVVARRESAIDEIRNLFPEIQVISSEFTSTQISGDVVISTLPTGAADTLDLAAEVTLAYDVIYAPWPTRFARNASDAGITVLGGLDLLVAQAVEQVILMTGCSEDHREQIASAMREAGESIQRERSRQD